MQPMEPIIETRELTRRFGALTAVDHLNLTVAEGEIFGLVGPDGAGKTTTLRMLCGLIDPTAGSARVGAAAGEGHLARMAAQGVGAAGEDHRQAVLPLHQGHQDGGQGGRRGVVSGLQPRIEVEVRADQAAGPLPVVSVVVEGVKVAGDPGADFRGRGSLAVWRRDHSWCAPTGPTGNQAPLEDTPICGPAGV